MKSQNQFGLDQLTPLVQMDDYGVYQIQNESGEGRVSMYEVFPGVSLAYNDFHMSYFQSEFVPKRNMLCIDHCREGRLEYAAGDDAYSYVEAGDLKLDRRLNHTGRFEMPLSHYHGMMVTFDMDTIDETLPSEIKDFPVDIHQLQRKYCPDKYPMVLHGLPSIEHICSELYAVPQQIRKPYFKIKILELLLYLHALELPEKPDARPYFYKSQVEKIKAIKKLLSENMEESYTQEALSRQFDIPITTMKRCFKSVFGTSIGSWLTEYRMNQAAALLMQNTKMSVAEVAGRVGYESPSKFAIAFRRVMGMSPLEYRKK